MKKNNKSGKDERRNEKGKGTVREKRNNKPFSSLGGTKSWEPYRVLPGFSTECQRHNRSKIGRDEGSNEKKRDGEERKGEKKQDEKRKEEEMRAKNWRATGDLRPAARLGQLAVATRETTRSGLGWAVLAFDSANTSPSTTRCCHVPPSIELPGRIECDRVPFEAFSSLCSRCRVLGFYRVLSSFIETLTDHQELTRERLCHDLPSALLLHTPHYQQPTIKTTTTTN